MRTLSQGRHLDRKNIQAIVEVIAESFVREQPSLRSRLVAAIIRTSTEIGFGLPKPLDLFFLENPQKFYLHLERQFADLVKKQS